MLWPLMLCGGKRGKLNAATPLLGLSEDNSARLAYSAGRSLKGKAMAIVSATCWFICVLLHDAGWPDKYIKIASCFVDEKTMLG